MNEYRPYKEPKSEIDLEKETTNLFYRAAQTAGDLEVSQSILRDAYDLAEHTGRESIKLEVLTRLTDSFETRIVGNVELVRKNQKSK